MVATIRTEKGEEPFYGNGNFTLSEEENRDIFTPYGYFILRPLKKGALAFPKNGHHGNEVLDELGLQSGIKIEPGTVINLGNHQSIHIS